MGVTEVISKRARCPTRAAEQLAPAGEEAQQVAGGQGGAGQEVDAVAVRAVQTGGLHRRGEELGVGRAGLAAAVLVELDLGVGRLAPSGLQPGEPDGVRVGLLELVGGPVDHELPELLARSVLLDEPRERRPVEVGQHRVHGDPRTFGSGQLGPPVAVGARQVGTHGLEEHILEPVAAGDEQVISFLGLVDALEGPVAELVQAVQRQVQVVVAERVTVERGWHGEGGSSSEAAQDPRGHRPASGRERRRRRLDVGWRWSVLRHGFPSGVRGGGRVRSRSGRFEHRGPTHDVGGQSRNVVSARGRSSG